MSKVTVPLMEVTIRRDANTITQHPMPPYEIAISRNLFGKENVTELEMIRPFDVDAENEYERLCAKYGHEVVAKVFGDDDGARLQELVEKAAIVAEKEKPATKSSKKDAE